METYENLKIFFENRDSSFIIRVNLTIWVRGKNVYAFTKVALYEEKHLPSITRYIIKTKRNSYGICVVGIVRMKKMVNYTEHWNLLCE